MKIWKTINIGTHKSKDELLIVLKEKGIQVTDSKDLWDSPAFQVCPVQKECKLVRTSVVEMGFDKPALYEDICKKAQEIGLNLCPAEVAPQIKLQYRQPRQEYLSIGMSLIEGRYFKIEFGFSYDVNYLRANVFNPKVITFGLDSEFIFCVD